MSEWPSLDERPAVHDPWPIATCASTWAGPARTPSQSTLPPSPPPPFPPPPLPPPLRTAIPVRRYENYHWVPSVGEHVNYYSGRMPVSGNLVRMKHHVHMNLLHKAYFLAASADDLQLYARPTGPDGMDMGAKEVPGAFFSHGGRLGKLLDSTETDPNLNTWPVGVAAVTKFNGARDHDEFERQLLGRVRELDAEARQRGVAHGEETIVKCSLSRGSIRIDGFLWDRAGQSICTPWTFAKGDVFTSVSLLKYHGDKARRSTPTPALETGPTPHIRVRDARRWDRGRRPRHRRVCPRTTSGTCTLSRPTARRTTSSTRR